MCGCGKKICEETTTNCGCTQNTNPCTASVCACPVYISSDCVNNVKAVFLFDLINFYKQIILNYSFIRLKFFG